MNSNILLAERSPMQMQIVMLSWREMKSVKLLL